MICLETHSRITCCYFLNTNPGSSTSYCLQSLGDLPVELFWDVLGVGLGMLGVGSAGDHFTRAFRPTYGLATALHGVWV